MKYSLNYILFGLVLSFVAMSGSSYTYNIYPAQFESINFKDSTRLKVYIDGMSCMRCTQKIEKKVSAIDGVRKVNVFLEEKYAIIIFENKTTKIEAIIAKIEDSGYTVIKHEIIKNKKG